MRQADNRIARGIFVADQEPSGDHGVDERYLRRPSANCESGAGRAVIASSPRRTVVSALRDGRQDILDIRRKRAHDSSARLAIGPCEAAERPIRRKC